jgi:hypothetical protein
MDLSRIPIGRNPSHDVNVTIEIPQDGAPVKPGLCRSISGIAAARPMPISAQGVNSAT